MLRSTLTSRNRGEIVSSMEGSTLIRIEQNEEVRESHKFLHKFYKNICDERSFQVRQTEIEPRLTNISALSCQAEQGECIVG